MGDGAWDMFHSGHISSLQKARAKGDYLIVGVHNDKLVNELRGSNHPIINMHERVLSVLGCRYVDDVLLDAPRIVTTDMIKSLNIGLVVQGTVRDNPIVDPYAAAGIKVSTKRSPAPRVSPFRKSCGVSSHRESTTSGSSKRK